MNKNSADKRYTPARAAALEKRMLAKALDQKYRPVIIDGHQVWEPVTP